MVIYNDSFMENATSPIDLINGLSAQIQVGYSEYTFAYLILLTFFLLFLTLAMRYPFREVLVIDSFLTTIIAILLYGAQIIPGMAIVYPLIVFLISLILYFIIQ